MKIIFLTILFLVADCCILHAQFVAKGTVRNDTNRIALYELYHPSYTPKEVNAPTNPYSDIKKIQGFSRSLFIFGVDLIRGKAEEHSIYSFENSWTYPGPTIKYPETATDMDFFLKRYHRFSIAAN